MHNTKSATSKAGKGSSKSSRQPLFVDDDDFNLQTPWPEDPDGYVVPQKQIEDFIGNQTVYEAQLTAERFVVLAEACQALLSNQKVDLNLRLIRYIASEDRSADYQQVMKAMKAAIKAGEEGIQAAYSTARYLLEFGFEYTTCCNREKLYERAVEQMQRAAQQRK